MNIQYDDTKQMHDDEHEYKSCINLLMRELIARVDACNQYDNNNVSRVALLSIRNACETYVDTIERTHE